MLLDGGLALPHVSLDSSESDSSSLVLSAKKTSESRTASVQESSAASCGLEKTAEEGNSAGAATPAGCSRNVCLDTFSTKAKAFPYYS